MVLFEELRRGEDNTCCTAFDSPDLAIESKTLRFRGKRNHRSINAFSNAFCSNEFCFH